MSLSLAVPGPGIAFIGSMLKGVDYY